MSFLKRKGKGAVQDSNGQQDLYGKAQRTPPLGKSNGQPPLLPDFTQGLSPSHFELTQLAQLGLDHDPTVMAFDVIQGLLAVGMSNGSIYVYGRSGVRSVIPSRNKPAQRGLDGAIKARTSSAIKLLSFKSGTSLLLAIDGMQTLYIWDLAMPQGPSGAVQGIGAASAYQFTPQRIVAHSLRTNATSLEVHPAHDWVFIGLEDGTADVYDADRLMPALFRVPHLFAGQSTSRGRRGVNPLLMEIKFHPSVLNLVLFAYDCGLVIWDLKSKQSVKKCILALPPFSAGSGSATEDPRVERRPPVISACWSPDGNIVAAGHEDGCISFWNVASHDRAAGQPGRDLPNQGLITVRAGRSEDVHFPQSSHQSSKEDGVREPVFKLTWSTLSSAQPLSSAAASYWYGTDRQSSPATALTVLGGGMPQDGQGLFVYTFEQGSHVAETDQLRASLRTRSIELISADSPVDDFILLPRNNPWYAGAGACDPLACIAILSTPPTNDSKPLPKYVKCWPYPSGGQDMSMPIDLVWAGTSPMTGFANLLGCKVLDLPISSYRRLIQAMGPLHVEADREERHAQQSNQGVDNFNNALRLNGGRLLNPPKPLGLKTVATILISWHSDGFIRFWDATTPAYGACPVELPHCAIATSEVLQGLLGSDPIIEDVHLATETLELAIVVYGGLVALWRMESGGRNLKASTHLRGSQNQEKMLQETMDSAYADLSLSGSQPTLPESLADEPLVDLRGRQIASYSAFRALALVNVQKGHVIALSLSNVGFLAISWERQALAIIDLRGPDLILLEDFAKQAGANPLTKGVKSTFRKTSQGDSFIGQNVVRLMWAITPLQADPGLAPRLLASTQSGLTKIFTCSNVLDQWMVEPNAPTLNAGSSSDPVASFILNTRDGTSCAANGDNLMKALQQDSLYQAGHPHEDHLWILVTKRGARIFVNLDPNDKVGRANWDADVSSAQLIDLLGAKVLACIHNDGRMRLLSIPGLRLVKEFVLPGDRASWFDVSSTSLSQNGRALVLEGSQARFYSLISLSNLKDSPASELFDPERTRLPPRPGENIMTQALGAMSYWIGTSMTYVSVEELDQIIGGQNRPPPRVNKEAVAQVMDNARRDARPRPTAAPLVKQGDHNDPVSREKQRILAAREAEEAGATGWAAYNPFAGMTDSVDERGEKLGFLQEKFNALEEASSSMAKNARKALLQQQAKSFLGL